MNEHDIVDINGFPAVVIGGIPRILNKHSPDPVKWAAFPPFVGEAPTVDPALWVEINRRIDFGDQFILDQQSHGSCVGFSSAGATMRAAVLAGHAFVRLSGAYTYSWINGNQDNGAQIADSLTSLMSHGTCTEAEVDWNHIYRRQIPASADATAQRFRVLEGYKANNFIELMSGIQEEFIGVVAVMVGNTFTRLNGDGVCGFDSGPGNHAVCIDGARKLSSGQWVLDMPNSWGLSFGQNGRGYLTQRHIESVEQDCYLIRGVRMDPLDPNKPPAVAG